MAKKVFYPENADRGLPLSAEVPLSSIKALQKKVLSNMQQA